MCNRYYGVRAWCPVFDFHCKTMKFQKKNQNYIFQIKKKKMKTSPLTAIAQLNWISLNLNFLCWNVHWIGLKTSAARCFIFLKKNSPPSTVRFICQNCSNCPKWNCVEPNKKKMDAVEGNRWERRAAAAAPTKSRGITLQSVAKRYFSGPPHGTGVWCPIARLLVSIGSHCKANKNHIFPHLNTLATSSQVSDLLKFVLSWLHLAKYGSLNCLLS